MATNYLFKSQVLKDYNDILMEQRKASMYTYSISLFNQYGIVNTSLLKNNDCMTIEQLERYCACLGLSHVLKECYKLNDAWFHRVKRLKDRISEIISSDSSSFITLTFTDEVLESTSQETRRRYVSRWCKSFGVPYVANIDFGKTTHREHYHCVIGCLMDEKSWSYGFMDIKPIRTHDGDIERLSKYVSKLSNHAIKETTKRSALIYSR